MIVTWIAIQSQPLPWESVRTDVAYVACGERAGELSLVRPRSAKDPGLSRLLDSLEEAIDQEKREGTVRPNLSWLRRAIPDQGTSIRLSAVCQCRAASYDDQIRSLAARLPTP